MILSLHELSYMLQIVRAIHGFFLTLLRQVRRHLDNKNKRLSAFYFVLCSVCTNFASPS